MKMLKLHLGLMSGMWRTVGSLCISASRATVAASSHSVSARLMLEAAEMLLVRGKERAKDWDRSLRPGPPRAVLLNLLAWK